MEKKNHMYILDEMVDIDQGINKGLKMIEEHEKLIKVIESSDMKDDEVLIETVDGLKEKIDDINKNIQRIQIKRGLIKEIIDIYRAGLIEGASEEAKANSELVEHVVENLFYALNVVKLEDEEVKEEN